jgi:hypothetical protein
VPSRLSLSALNTVSTLYRDDYPSRGNSRKGIGFSVITKTIEKNKKIKYLLQHSKIHPIILKNIRMNLLTKELHAVHSISSFYRTTIMNL